MALRPIFVPNFGDGALVRTMSIEFTWHPGLAVSQKQKSIASLHEAARRSLGVGPILEISSKSDLSLGVELSAFSLSLSIPDRSVPVCVECLFQGSKVFELGGPYRDIFDMTGGDAKRDERLQNSRRLIGFDFFGTEWELEPQTAFYDWIYITALMTREELATQISRYSAFTDIEFNPERSISCQAYSVALFASLLKSGQLHRAIRSKREFLELIQAHRISNARQDDTVQRRLF